MTSARNHLLAALVASSMLGSAPAARAQGEVPSTPEEVAELLFRATEARDWRGFAELMHPDAVTEFHDMLRPVLDLVPEGDSTLLSLFAVDNAADLKDLEPLEFFASFVGGVMGGVYAELDVFSDRRHEVVGSIAEGDVLSHVVYRSTYGMMGVSLTQLQVVTAKRYREGWRLLLTAELAGISQMLEQMAAQLSGQDFNIPVR